MPFGAALLALAAAAGVSEPPRPLMRDFIGINTHTVKFQPERYRTVASRVRNYHPAEWDLQKEPGVLPPWPKSKNGVDWDALYGGWKQAGWRTIASVMLESVPLSDWTRMEEQMEAYGEALARRFGPTAGNGHLEAVEIGNEPEAWDGPTYRRAFQAMSRGLQRGDPALPIATCAVAVGDWDRYSKDINLLLGLERSFDVLNIHTYAFAEHWPTWRRTHPEDPSTRFLSSVKEMAAWRDAHAPGRPIWVTEFGWDSTTRPRPTEGGMKDFVPNSDEDQARWLVRGFLAFASLPVDRAYMFWFDDDDEWGLHAASGLTRKGEPKPSFHAVSQLQSLLGNFRYAGMVVEEPDARIARFTGSEGRIAWVAWSPTAGGKSKRVTVKSGLRFLRSERFRMGPGEGLPVPITRRDGEITLTLTEDPAYLFFAEGAGRQSL
ncbi:MAG: hypothetical protein MH204_04750 [Fimbriimonadaceae bacterium]|nr:hypothetical protein [Fimbriimonadaceae bacterium]